jgi:hypothetical protein
MPEDPEPLRDVVSFEREHVGILAALGPNSASSATVVELDADVVDLVCGVARRMNRSVLALRRAWARCDPHRGASVRPPSTARAYRRFHDLE